MKKKLLALLLCAVTASVVLGGCGKDTAGTASVSAEAEADVVIPAKELLKATDYDVTKYVTLMDDYMNLDVELESDYEVTDEAIKEYIELTVLPNYPMSVPSEKTTVEEGDTVNIDYVGTLDGVAFDGGTAEGADLTIGSGQFIDGFESGLVGVEVGSTVDLNLTFPEGYQAEDLAGQDVVFTVTVNSINETVEITYDELSDEYVASTLGTYGMQTVEDLNNEVRQMLEDQYSSEKQSEVQTKVMEVLTAGCQVEFPEGIVDARVNLVLSQIEAAATEQGAEVMDYVAAYYGYDDMDAFKEYLNTTLTEQITQELILEAVVADQDTSITLGDFNQFVDAYVQYYQYPSAQDFYDVYGGEDIVKLNFAENNMLSQIIDNAIAAK